MAEAKDQGNRTSTCYRLYARAMCIADNGFWFEDQHRHCGLTKIVEHCPPRNAYITKLSLRMPQVQPFQS